GSRRESCFRARRPSGGWACAPATRSGCVTARRGRAGARRRSGPIAPRGPPSGAAVTAVIAWRARQRDVPRAGPLAATTTEAAGGRRRLLQCASAAARRDGRGVGAGVGVGAVARRRRTGEAGAGGEAGDVDRV